MKSLLKQGISTRMAFGEEIVKIAESNEKIVVIDADISRSMYTVEFSKRFPDRHINVGIAEQNQMAVAAGLAFMGFSPVVSSYAVFASMRSLEQLRTSICYPNLSVVVAASHGGITPANDGVTHQGIEDVGIMRTIPNMTIVVPCDGYSLKILLNKAFDVNGPVYLRMTRDPVPFIYESDDKDFSIGKARQLRDGRDVAIIAAGDMVQWALEAHEILKNQGIKSRVLDMHTIKPLDIESVVKAARETGCVVTVEDHNMYNGLGSAVAEVLGENVPVPFKRIALRDTFAESGPYTDLLKKYKMSTEDIVNAAIEVVSRKNKHCLSI